MPTEPVTGVNGLDIVNYARTQLGDPYVWGAEGPDAFDCSGLVEYVFKRFGLNTPRTTADMLAGKGGLQSISEAQLQPGDLILSKGWISSAPNQGHVGIYAGNGKIIEAGDPVQVTTFGPTYRAHVTGFRRVPGMAGYGSTATSSATTGGYTGGLPNPLNPGQVAGALVDWIPNPKNVTGALTNIGNAMLGIGQSAQNIGAVASAISRALLPSNLLRGFMLAMGIVFILIGIWFLASEAKDA